MSGHERAEILTGERVGGATAPDQVLRFTGFFVFAGAVVLGAAIPARFAERNSAARPKVMRLIMYSFLSIWITEW